MKTVTSGELGGSALQEHCRYRVREGQNKDQPAQKEKKKKWLGQMEKKNLPTMGITVDLAHI